MRDEGQDDGTPRLAREVADTAQRVVTGGVFYLLGWVVVSVAAGIRLAQSQDSNLGPITLVGDQAVLEPLLENWKKRGFCFALIPN